MYLFFNITLVRRVELVYINTKTLGKTFQVFNTIHNLLTINFWNIITNLCVCVRIMWIKRYHHLSCLAQTQLFKNEFGIVIASQYQIKWKIVPNYTVLNIESVRKLKNIFTECIFTQNPIWVDYVNLFITCYF